MMKKWITLSLASTAALVSMWAFSTAEKAIKDELAIGADAPMLDTPLKDVSGNMITMQEAAGENGLLVIFSCNTCPWVARWEDRYNPMADLAKEKGIGTIALNPNAGSRKSGDSFEDMRERAKESEYQFYYALDEKAKIADAFGATHTPHIYLFNSEMKLVYRGAIDDNAQSAEEVEKPYLKNAIQQLAAGEAISDETSKSLGCSIKFPKTE